MIAQLASGLVYLLHDNGYLPLRLLASRPAQQLIGSVVGPLCYVLCGAALAPSRRLLVAVILSSLNAVFLGYSVASLVSLPGFALTATVNYAMPGGLQAQSDPAWWVIASAVVGIAVTILACVWVRHREQLHNSPRPST
jgi:hypothetical protein